MTKAKSEKQNGRAARIEQEFRFPRRYRLVPPEQRHLAKPGETELRNCKVRVSIYLDADIIRFFKERAVQPGAQPYQTQINATLREVIQHAWEGGAANQAASIGRLLSNEQFIEAVARQVGKRLASRSSHRA